MPQSRLLFTKGKRKRGLIYAQPPKSYQDCGLRQLLNHRNSFWREICHFPAACGRIVSAQRCMYPQNKQWDDFLAKSLKIVVENSSNSLYLGRYGTRRSGSTKALGVRSYVMTAQNKHFANWQAVLWSRYLTTPLPIEFPNHAQPCIAPHS